MSTLTIKSAPSGNPYVDLSVQSPKICDLMDEIGLRWYRSDYRDVTTMIGIQVFTDADDIDKLKKFIEQAQPLVDEAERELNEQKHWIDTENKKLDDKRERDRVALKNRIAADAKNISKIGDFTGGKKIIFTVATNEYADLVGSGFWIGKIGTCVSVDDVSPNAIRSGTSKPSFRIHDDSDPVPGNSNSCITRYFGWRGTTNDRSVHAHGVRMVEKIVQFRNHARIYISRYDKNYND